MKAEKARRLKLNDRVLVQYTPKPGHGQPISRYGIVEHVGQKTYKNMASTMFVWVTIRLYGDDHASVYPSWCIH